MKDHETMFAFIEQYSFANIISRGSEQLHGTHLPLLYERRVEGDYLIGHMAKANPQWKSITGDVLVIFNGPHTYVSPAFYEKEGFVPTWDYQAVHVYGTYYDKSEPEDLKRIMNNTIHFYESTQTSPWHGNVPDEIYNRLIKGVVGFEIAIERMEGQWKLHQDHPIERRQLVKKMP
ncbi:FMN-binding negative transcriptional regulator [Geomicrobium sp. JCM 19055]|uniref:FMN-binding negative transcriptional regulator n=1 Tax=Geomicrobium sp. JCM 19055 TaxID=1460649 RepID=UPI00045ED980|nr:FMN-binding negative transcriptional regulator [Geomicrobium sp. JCM 19055]GAJ97377.1 protease synthase and sporulation negative regulatory protein PAI 2 [Geomicrobium sp. JCM 19055]